MEICIRKTHQQASIKIKNYTERIIRSRILSKLKPQKINKKARHWKGYIFIDKKVIAKVKIPNDHRRVMCHNKSQYIARDLKLTPKDFNRLIDCPLKGSEYYQKLAKYTHLSGEHGPG